MKVNFTKDPLGVYNFGQALDSLVNKLSNGVFYHSDFATKLREARKFTEEQRNLCIKFCVPDDLTKLEPELDYCDEMPALCHDPAMVYGEIGPIPDLTKIYLADFNRDIEKVLKNFISKITSFIDSLTKILPEEELYSSNQVSFKTNDNAWRFSYFNPYGLIKDDGAINHNINQAYRITLPDRTIITLKSSWLKDQELDEDSSTINELDCEFGEEIILGKLLEDQSEQLISFRFPEDSRPYSIDENGNRKYLKI